MSKGGSWVVTSSTRATSEKDLNEERRAQRKFCTEHRDKRIHGTHSTSLEGNSQSETRLRVTKGANLGRIGSQLNGDWTASDQNLSDSSKEYRELENPKELRPLNDRFSGALIYDTYRLVETPLLYNDEVVKHVAQCASRLQPEMKAQVHNWPYLDLRVLTRV